jgi:formamidopyrimidine-DNA glycosylase
MPELPEVETTRRGIEPHLAGHRIAQLIVRCHRLRYPIDDHLPAILAGETINAVERRAKYLLLRLSASTLLIHLGMSGSLRLVNRDEAFARHDHWQLDLVEGYALRLHDPRRFGALLWYQGADSDQPLLAHLGPEPLEEGFTADYLYRATRRRSAIKSLIMQGSVVVGVGNIYASESLFRARLRPSRSAASLSLAECSALVEAIRQILTQAITQGGTTLRDFVGSDGRPGYFAQQLAVYGRAGASCRDCGSAITSAIIGQRNTFWCPHCQP